MTIKFQELLLRLLLHVSTAYGDLRDHLTQRQARLAAEPQRGASALEYVIMAALGVAICAIIAVAIMAAVNAKASQLGS